MVPGSRPTSTHARSSAADRSAKGPGIAHMFQVSACRATRPSMRSPFPPIDRGRCACRGFGSQRASRNLNHLPSNVVTVRSSSDRTTVQYSSRRESRCEGEPRCSPYCSCSLTCQPAPRPSVIRPALTWSSVATQLATSAGCRWVAERTSGARRTSVVATARAASTEVTSRRGSSTAPNAAPSAMKWSSTTTPDHPLASTWRTTSSRSRHCCATDGQSTRSIDGVWSIDETDDDRHPSRSDVRE